MGEKALLIPCEGSELVGILHTAAGGAPETGLIVVVGGPQTRIGVNRQFVMLARQMADRGIPTLRFDHRGVGDSGGDYRGFEDMDGDLRAAIDTLIEEVPSVRRVALWGVCESASSIAFYGWQDPRVAALCMVNPWIRTEAGEAKAYVKHWYLSRLRSRDFWKKLLSGRFDAMGSLRSLLGLLGRIGGSSGGAKAPGKADLASLPLPARLQASTTRFEGRLTIVLSGRDLVAREFADHAKESAAWQAIFARAECDVVELAEADHTCSRLDWRRQLFDATAAWVGAIEPAGERRDTGT